MANVETVVEQHDARIDRFAMAAARKVQQQATNDDALYGIGKQHRSHCIADSKHGGGGIGSSPSLMLAITRLIGDSDGATKAAIVAYCKAVPCGPVLADGRHKGNPGFFAYALANGWLTCTRGAQVADTTSELVKPVKGKGKADADADASATKPAKPRKQRKPKVASPTVESPANDPVGEPLPDVLPTGDATTGVLTIDPSPLA